jgi:hypothetical protein
MHAESLNYVPVSFCNIKVLISWIPLRIFQTAKFYFAFRSAGRKFERYQVCRCVLTWWQFPVVYSAPCKQGSNISPFLPEVIFQLATWGAQNPRKPRLIFLRSENIELGYHVGTSLYTHIHENKWSLTLREQRKLQASENKFLRNLDSKRAKWATYDLHKEELP